METATVTSGANDIMDAVIGNLGDIPDLSGIGGDSEPTKWENGWYRGQVLGTRSFTDKNGNDRVFESTDGVSAKGDSRNIRLQTVITRKDGKTLNSSVLINYNPDDLSQETVQAIAAKLAEAKDKGEQPEWGPLFRSYMTLQRLSALQKIAGVRQLQRNAEGGLDITPLFGKTGFFRLKDDSRNAAYKEVDKFQPNAPTKVPVL